MENENPLHLMKPVGQIGQISVPEKYFHSSPETIMCEAHLKIQQQQKTGRLLP